MTYVIIDSHRGTVPSDPDIRAAMMESGGSVTRITPSGAMKRVDFTGSVDHATFVRNLTEVAQGHSGSWHYYWGNATAEAAAGFRLSPGRS